jgi:hypothetical protein
LDVYLDGIKLTVDVFIAPVWAVVRIQKVKQALVGGIVTGEVGRNFSII